MLLIQASGGDVSLSDMSISAIFAGILLCCLLLGLFLLPDYICWRRRVRKLPWVDAHHIQVREEELAKRIKNVVEEVAEEDRFQAFCESAKHASLCESREKGGKIRRFTYSDMPYSVEKACFAAKLNTVQGPIFCATTQCWHLLWVVARFTGREEKKKNKDGKEVASEKGATQKANDKKNN